MLRHPAGVQELLIEKKKTELLIGIGKPPCTYLGIGSKKPLLIPHFNLLFPTNYEYFFHVIINYLDIFFVKMSIQIFHPFKLNYV